MGTRYAGVRSVLFCLFRWEEQGIVLVQYKNKTKQKCPLLFSNSYAFPALKDPTSLN